MYPSGINGTDSVTKIIKESYSVSEAFKLSLRLQTVNVVEVDSSNTPGLATKTVQMENDPDFLVDEPSADPALIGNIWINYQNLEKDIFIYRERWIEHIAYIGGMNLFWVIIFKILLSCFTKNQFHTSLRNEIDPRTVKKADQNRNGSCITRIRRKFCGASKILGSASIAEQQLDIEIADHCSIKNLYDVTKLVHEQQDLIKS